MTWVLSFSTTSCNLFRLWALGRNATPEPGIKHSSGHLEQVLAGMTGTTGSSVPLNVTPSDPVDTWQWARKFIFGPLRPFQGLSEMTTPRPGAGCRFSIEYGLECRKPWFPMGLSQSERLGDRPCCFFSGPPVGKELLEIVVSCPRGRQELSVSQFIAGFRIRKKSFDIRFPLREERSHF